MTLKRHQRSSVDVKAMSSNCNAEDDLAQAGRVKATACLELIDNVLLLMARAEKYVYNVVTVRRVVYIV